MSKINTIILENECLLELNITEFISKKDLSFIVFSQEKIWRKLVPHISNLLIQFIETNHNSGKSPEVKNLIFKEAAAKLIEANRHLKMNADIGMLLEFTKCYKRSYNQLVIAGKFERELEREYLLYIEEFFDNIEVNFSSTWVRTFKDELVKDFKAKSDIIIETLRKSEERYHQLVEQASDGIFTINNTGKYIEVNTKCHSMLGYSYEEMLNKYIVDVISPDEVPRASRELEELNSGKSIISEWKLKCKDQSIVTVELSAKKLPDNCILGMVRDITERKREEENMKSLQNALEYDKLKTEFFSNISHELRTPINVIMSALQMCDMLHKTNALIDNMDRVNRYFGIMKQNCYRLIKLVNNLIDITRIDSGYLQLELNNYNIINIIEDITLSVADYIENKGINLIFDTDAEEIIMACDPDKIERIVLNILSNAVKFTEPGGTITVSIKNEQENIIISIIDTGSGIPEDKQKLIFERFVQVDKSLSRKNEGSGIGLSLVKSLVEMHNGYIYLNSIPNKGSEFIVKLPVRVLKQSNDNSKHQNYIQQSNTERIHIEFSDIYS